MAIRDPATFIHWDDVFRAFGRANNGVNPLLNLAGAWLAVAAHSEANGRPAEAERYLEAGLMREAYDRDTYEPPAEYQRLYVTPSLAEGERT